MTILVGVLCSDGVVIGADSSTTFAVQSGFHTIEQVTGGKIVVINNRVIVAGTGSVGLMQRFCHVVSKSSVATQPKVTSFPVEVGRELSKAARDNFGSTGATPGQFGALVAFRANGEAALCEFDVQNFQPELKTSRIWYCSMGSGQMIVDPFLGFIRRCFWKSGPPNCHDGAFAVTCALKHAIDLNAGGIGGPMEIAVLRANPAPGEPGPRKLTPDEISQHESNAQGLEDHMAQYSCKQLDMQPGAPKIPDVSRPADTVPPGPAAALGS